MSVNSSLNVVSVIIASLLVKPGADIPKASIAELPRLYAKTKVRIWFRMLASFF